MHHALVLTICATRTWKKSVGRLDLAPAFGAAAAVADACGAAAVDGVPDLAAPAAEACEVACQGRLRMMRAYAGTMPDCRPSNLGLSKTGTYKW